MGLLAPLAEFMLHEHKYKRIEGDVLFVGRQTVYLTEQTLDVLLRRHGLKNLAAGPVEYDNETVEGKRLPGLITDRYFMKSLGVKKVRFMDVTKYENADIVHDLGYEVDKSLHNRFDFIYNGGCLDNMFNPGIALMNMSKMLKTGGRIICMESAGSWNCPYLMFSPGWFYDYFAVNGYSDCKTYIAAYPNNRELVLGPWNMYSVNMGMNKNGPSPETVPNCHLLVLAIAEKGKSSTSEKQPIQHQYRLAPKLIDEFERNESVIRASTRPFWGRDPQEYLTPAGALGKDLDPRGQAGQLK